jgi:hypothetical protein
LILKAIIPKNYLLELHNYIDKPVYSSERQIGTILRAESIGEEIELTIETTDTSLIYNIGSASFSMRGVQ